jgi:hypothetical protein
MPKDSLLGLQPAPAWTAILALVVFTAAGIAAGAGGPLRLLFPLLSLAVGILLYRKYPLLYIGFAWWLWFLTPLVRRLIDYRSSWVNPSPVLTAPFLVTLISLVTVWNYLPKILRQGGAPFLLALIGIFYGFLIGVVNSSPMAATRALLDWLAPVVFGFHLYIQWQNYPTYRRSIQRIFLWGVLLMGIYGVYQYMVAPEWDKFWLINSEVKTFGDPEPQRIRVWSTMASPGPFSVAMMAGLLLLFNTHQPLGPLASVVGYLSFLLSQSRSRWGMWLIGLIMLTSTLKLKFQIRLVLIGLVLALCVLPLTQIEPFAEVIGNRLGTLQNLDTDTSAQARSDIYAGGLTAALSNFLGSGIGNTFGGGLIKASVDSGVIDLFNTLGLLGGLPYLLGLLLILFILLRSPVARSDPFMNASRAIGLSLVLGLLNDSVMLAAEGVVMWSFLGLAMAAHQYDQHQQLLMPNHRSNHPNPSDANLQS